MTHPNNAIGCKHWLLLSIVLVFSSEQYYLLQKMADCAAILDRVYLGRKPRVGGRGARAEHKPNARDPVQVDEDGDEELDHAAVLRAAVEGGVPKVGV